MMTTSGTITVTDVPVIKVNGAAAFGTGLLSVCVRRSLNAVAHVQIRVRSDHADAAKARVEAALTIALKADNAETSLFDGEIVSVGVELRRMGAELVIDAYDKAHRLMRRAPVVTHLNKKPSDIVTSLAPVAGLTASVAAFGPQYEVYHQWGQTGRCLDELCRSFGQEWWVEGSTLHVRKRTDSPPDSGVTLTAGEGLRVFNVRFSAGEQVQSVDVRGWDVATKTSITGSATAKAMPVTNGPATATTTAGRQGPHIWSPFVKDATAATDIATGAASEASVGIVTGRGECDADARIVPGKTVTIAGMGDAWNGKYYVTAVEHLLGLDQPFITRFTIGGADAGGLVDLLGEAAQPSTGQLVHGLTIGIVTNNQDANESLKLNRVKVKFPYLTDSDESQWARVAIPGGGKGRGLMQLPEVDDEVLVGFENGDLAKPVVLGGLWNGKDAPPLNTSSAELLEGNMVASRQWVSRIGHRIVLVDKSADGEQIKIELKDKKTFVTLTKDKGVIVNAKEQDIEVTNGGTGSIKIAKNGDITIKGAKVTIEATQDLSLEGVNVKATGKSNLDIEGKAGLTAKGGGTAELSASGITTVKGSMVKVN
jgi:phage baseplate assembly protein gpV